MDQRQSARWMRLDNAAKLYASVSSKRDPKVFRFACQLTEPVRPDLLQQALDGTISQFPLYRCVLRRGLFWYFLEPSNLRPQVHEEDRPPCERLYDRIARGLLFNVTYYQKRVSLEVYHVLTDGTGALQFLRALILNYLLLAHPEAFDEAPPILDYGASETEKSVDSFNKYYEGAGSVPPSAKNKPAAHFRGLRLPENHIRVIEGELEADAVRACTKKCGASLTHFLCAILMHSIAAELPVRERRKPVVLTIPVNLRNFFESESARNFFSVFHVTYLFKQPGEPLESVIHAVAESFQSELTYEKLSARMNRMAAVEHNYLTRAIPLPIKDIALAVANHMSERCVTGGFSNLGRIEMPEECVPYIYGFDVFMSSDRIQLCACSYQNRLLLSLTAPFISTDVQKRFFRTLSSMGLSITINANDASD